MWMHTRRSRTLVSSFSDCIGTTILENRVVLSNPDRLKNKIWVIILRSCWHLAHEFGLHTSLIWANSLCLCLCGMDIHAYIPMHMSMEATGRLSVSTLIAFCLIHWSRALHLSPELTDRSSYQLVLRIPALPFQRWNYYGSCTAGHLPGFCRSELQYPPLHTHHYMMSTVASALSPHLILVALPCHFTAATYTLRWPRPGELRNQSSLEWVKNNLPILWADIIRESSEQGQGSPEALWEIIIKTVWSQSPGCLYRKM